MSVNRHDDEEQAHQFHEALPNDLFVEKILPLLEPPTIRHLPLVSKSWSVLCRANPGSPMWRAWCRNQRWLVMLCRTDVEGYGVCGGSPWCRNQLHCKSCSMEFVACRIPKDSPPSSEDRLCWMPLSLAMQGCISTLDLSFNTVSILRLDDYKPVNKILAKPVTMYPLDDRCLISGTDNGLMCLIWHANLRRRPLRKYTCLVRDIAALQLNTAAFTPMLVNILTGSAELLTVPEAYCTFVPQCRCGRLRNVFMSMQMSNHATKSFNIILHDDLLNFLEVYSSQTSSWRTVVNRQPCASDDYPFLNFTTTTSVHLGDVFAIRHHVPRAALYAYRADSDEWSKVDVQQPPNTLQLYSHVFKYNGRVFLAALQLNGCHSLLDSLQKFEGFGIWELKPSSANVYLWERVARSQLDHVYSKFAYCFLEFEIKFVNFGSLVCMTGAKTRGRELIKFPPLVYDIACNSWFLLPECKSVMDYLCVFGFQPKV